MYAFSFIVGNIIPKSVKCIHSATKKGLRDVGWGFVSRLGEWRGPVSSASLAIGD